MKLAVVFGFAVPDGLVPVVGAAPYDVIGRQLPRQLVQLLNAGGDRGARFFPFLGNTEGRRRFLHLRQLLPVATLASLHKNGLVGTLIDGALAADELSLRIHDAATQRLLHEVALPFNAMQPFDVLPRLQFELMSALRWEGRPQPAARLDDAALAWYLVAKDELLALEANLVADQAVDPLRAVNQCLALAPTAAAVHDIALETAAQVLRVGAHKEAGAALLRRLGETTSTFDLHRRVASLQQAIGDEDAAASSWTRAARLQPASTEAVENAASLWFRAGRLDQARAVLMLARAAGALGPSGIGQLAAVADRLGERALRDELTAELLAIDRLPVPVARLVSSFLLEDERAPEAARAAERALAHNPDDASLWLEHGRACLLLEDSERAAASLQRGLDLGLAGEARRDAERLLRMCSVRGLFAAMRQVDAALARGDRHRALRVARGLIRGGGDTAESWLFLGVVRQRLGHDWRAERALRQALTLDENLGEAHNRLGILLVGQGNVELGLQHLLRAELLGPSDPSPRLHLAQAYALLGRRGEGEHQLQEAARLGANAHSIAAIRRQFFAKGA